MMLPQDSVKDLANAFGTPLYVYSLPKLMEQVQAMKTMPSAFGLTVRYAMKALSTRAILQVIDKAGLYFDCSSEYEVQRLEAAGVEGAKISLVSQQFPKDVWNVVRTGAQILPTSISQLRSYGSNPALPRHIGIRINPGLGSGSNRRTNVGGPSASFGIWHEDIPEVIQMCQEWSLIVTKIHTHIGSGSDPNVWVQVAHMSLELLTHFPEVSVLSLGGGFKVARLEGESSCDIQIVGAAVSEAFQAFYQRTGRKIHLEVEPGTFLIANAGFIVSTVIDTVSTPDYDFLKLDSGMTEILRPSLYGAQHPIMIIPTRSEAKEYVVVGHCCESGDLLTPSAEDASLLQARRLTRAEVGDLCVIGGAGAYCSSMSAKNYNSYPEAAEVLLTPDPILIRTRQTVAQILENELSLPLD